MRVPSHASGFVLNELCGACAEVNRVGGYTIGVPVLQKLSQRLFGALADVYERFVEARTQDGAEAPSQEGWLQLLFDFTFVADVLVSGPSKARGAAVTDAEQQLARSAAIAAKLKVGLGTL